MNAARKFALASLFCVVPVIVMLGCGDRGEPQTREDERVRSEQVAERAEPGVTGEDYGLNEGQFPPPFTLRDLEGQEVSLSDYAGDVIVLDLWATWCGPCRAEVPFLVSLYDEFKDRGFVVLGVGLDREGERVLRPFAQEFGVHYPVLVGDRSVHEAYKIRSIPTTFVIGRNGRIAKRHVGFHPSMAEGMRAEIENLLEVQGEGV